MSHDKINFPEDIELQNSPLVEAWLDLRWKITPLSLTPAGPPRFGKDPGFPFALGKLYDSVREKYGYHEPLDASRAPEDMLPHVVRYRFRVGEDQWPLLQLGPGVATLNFVDSYSWDYFKKEALYLRTKLSDAYGDVGLDRESIAIRYRNKEQFKYSKNELTEFLENNLNTSVKLPVQIPGLFSTNAALTHFNLNVAYALEEPMGIGAIKIGTGMDKANNFEIVIWELEIVSTGKDAPEIRDEEMFSSWLDSAHTVAHEWFFSLIDGPLYLKYQKQG